MNDFDNLNFKLDYKIVSEICGISKVTFYNWKKEERDILKLLNTYFTNKELLEFKNTGKISRLEITKDFSPNKNYHLVSELIEDCITVQSGDKINDEQNLDIGIYLAHFLATMKIKMHKTDYKSYDSIDFNKLFIMYGNGNLELYESIKYGMTPNVIMTINELNNNNFFNLIKNKHFGKFIPIYILVDFYIPYILYKYNNSKKIYNTNDYIAIYNQYFPKDDITQDYGEIMYDKKIKHYSLHETIVILSTIIDDLLNYNNNEKIDNIDDMLSRLLTKR